MIKRIVSIVLALLVATVALVAWLNLRGEDGLDSPSPAPTADTVARGAYLARAGNCMGCHTTQGGAEYAGGRGIDTPFGTVFAPNLTPDEATGLGRWTEPEFWRAMHNGRAKDGRLLYPAFPYTNFTQVSRADSAAIYAFLRSLPPVSQANRPHELRFPYDSQLSLAVWRALYFRPGSFEPDPRQAADWNRGAYLVRGLGHCSACHAERDALGGSVDELRLAGGLIPVQNWYAPGVGGGDPARFAALMKDGVSKHGSVMGPMAEVVYLSSSHLEGSDVQAMARYVASLEPAEPVKRKSKGIDASVLDLGQRIYDKHCADCHGAHGEGRDGIYPPLAGNPSVQLSAAQNTVQAILHGGFAPATPGNPRPAGMPPFTHALDEAEIAAVASFVRQAWGNSAPPVSALEVMRVR
ncbi:c-type cytochrome [Paucibacter sp. R3-3]|uniref:C-type cytochrome n=1 Tax=Roseateles agri TaxID=3098619 RepID=A0ABU5DCB6_9BURK|nr:c-type cytochrome [Paucibacter sp. R3-3]MDY0743921.1 c-type cytochrome [Paucibacter sp. R3-3]